MNKLIVGITGGIGSGKTTVANLFSKYDVPIYNSDNRAKFLMNTDVNLVNDIKTLLGAEAYKEGRLNKSWVGNEIFNDKKKLSQLNAIVHPVVNDDFLDWVDVQDYPYVLKEAAILIESGAYKKCDKIIVVTAALENRIQRLLNRDNLTKNEILIRIQNQISEEQRLKFSNYVIDNDSSLMSLKYKIKNIHNEILKLSYKH